MAKPLISIRALDENHDPIYGNGAAAFLTDIDAVAQIIKTRLLLFQGEWWMDLTDGLPLFQSILGTSNPNKQTAIADLIRDNIQNAPFVTDVSEIESKFDSASRQFTFICYVNTVFGSLTVQFQPGASASITQ